MNEKVTNAETINNKNKSVVEDYKKHIQNLEQTESSIQTLKEEIAQKNKLLDKWDRLITNLTEEVKEWKEKYEQLHAEKESHEKTIAAYTERINQDNLLYQQINANLNEISELYKSFNDAIPQLINELSFFINRYVSMYSFSNQNANMLSSLEELNNDYNANSKLCVNALRGILNLQISSLRMDLSLLRLLRMVLFHLLSRKRPRSVLRRRVQSMD